MRLLLTVTLAMLLASSSSSLAQKKKNTKAEKAAKVAPLDLKGKTVEQVFNELLPGMGSKDIAARHQPQQQWQVICNHAGAPVNEGARLEVCKLMVAKLGADNPDPARVWLLKQLEVLGRDECVGPIANLLSDKSDLVRDSAVRALANNPSEKAGDALATALKGTQGKAKVALINALGYRGNAAGLAQLANELAGSDPTAVQAAARAIGKLAGPEAASRLAVARKAAKDSARLWICDAYLLCADRFLKEGKVKEAAAIYADVYDHEKARSIRMAALDGVLRTSGDDAGAKILDAIAGMDNDARDVALARISSISAKALQTLAGRIDKLPPQGQVMLLTALAARGDKSQKAAAIQATQSPNETIQRAGILALARLGDASVVPLLLEATLKPGKHAGPARESLIDLVGDGVDETIIASLKAEKAPPRRVSLIGILDARRSAAAVPVLLEDARGEDPAVRSSAMLALRKLAEPKDVPALVPALLKAAKGKERDEAEKSIALIVGRIVEPEKRADPVLTLVNDTTRADLLPLLGRIGGGKALAVVREAVAKNDPEGVQALANWPDATASPDLLKLVKETKDAARRQLAFRNLVRINSLSNEQPAAPRLVVLKDAMLLAEQGADKRLVIDALATVKDIETLRFVIAYLDDKELSQSACRTIVELAHSRTLREPNQPEFVRALDRVIAQCRDKGLVERAKKYKQGN